MATSTFFKHKQHDVEDDDDDGLDVLLCPPPSYGFMTSQVVLRVLTVVFAVVSIVVMLKSGTTVSVYGILFQTHYYNSRAYKFLLGVNIAVGVLVLLSLILVYLVHNNKKKNSSLLFGLFLNDLIVTVLMIGACGAATSIADVALNGQPASFWMKICNRAGKFCDKVAVSVGFSYAAFLCLLVLTILTSYNLKKSKS